jgi:hypothetical protein
LAHVTTGVLRRGGRALRSVGPGAVAVAAVALVIGATGVADAATGGSFLLGKTNIASSTSVLTDTAGIPLSLNAADDKQPFSVNSDVQVNRLNAQYVGGKSTAELQATGGIGIAADGGDIALPIGVETTVASTGPLPDGTYYVSATASLWSGGDSVWCEVTSGPQASGGGSGVGYIQAAETGLVTVPAKGIVSEACAGTGPGQKAVNAGIMAIRIDSSSVGTRSIVIRGNVGLPAKG